MQFLMRWISLNFFINITVFHLPLSPPYFNCPYYRRYLRRGCLLPYYYFYIRVSSVLCNRSSSDLSPACGPGTPFLRNPYCNPDCWSCPPIARSSPIDSAWTRNFDQSFSKDSRVWIYWNGTCVWISAIVQNPGESPIHYVMLSLCNGIIM